MNGGGTHLSRHRRQQICVVVDVLGAALGARVGVDAQPRTRLRARALCVLGRHRLIVQLLLERLTESPFGALGQAARVPAALLDQMSLGIVGSHPGEEGGEHGR